MNYRFTKLDDDGPAAGTSEIQNSQLETGVGSAQFRGAAIQLFGEPTLKSNHAEGAFLYVVGAVSHQGTRSILTVYEGPGGPAVGGNPEDPESVKAAKKLAQLIEATSPADFEEALIYHDFNAKIHYGCKAGVCFYEEQPVT